MICVADIEAVRQENIWQRYIHNHSVDEMVRRMVACIDEHFHPDLQAEHVARKVGYSPRHARRLCKQELGCSIGDLIRMKRMSLAKQLLDEQRISIKEVAVRVGYKNVSHFAAAFRRTYGCNPSLYVRNGNPFRC